MPGILGIQQYISKAWIYKDKCVVIDYQYKGVKFAFDIKIDKDTNLELFLVDRNDNIVYMYKKTYKQKVRLEAKIELNMLEEVILKHISSIFEFLDNIYKYDVSVIIPVYNREKLIRKCIDKINNQTFDKSRYEVIFVDDCSTDQSINVIHELVSSDLNYRVLSRPVGSGNASAPRNEGIKSSLARYVLFIDSDDYLSEYCVEKALGLADDQNSDLVYLKMGSDAEFPRAVPTRAYKYGTVKVTDVSKHHLLRSNAMCKLYKKSFLLRESLLLDPSISVAEDRLFSISILSKTRKVSILADDIYVYVTRHNEEHLTHKETDLEVELYLYLNGCNRIFLSNHDIKYRNQLYNGWMILIIERLISIMKSKKISNVAKQTFFSKVLLYCNFGDYYLDKANIYIELHPLLDSIVEKNYQQFFDLVNK